MYVNDSTEAQRGANNKNSFGGLHHNDSTKYQVLASESQSETIETQDNNCEIHHNLWTGEPIELGDDYETPIPYIGSYQVDADLVSTHSQNLSLDLDIDAEWVSRANRPNEFITLQLRPSGYASTMVMEHPSYGLGKLPSWEGQTPLPEILGAAEVRKPDVCRYQLTVTQWCFFSFGDIRAFWGDKLAAYIQRNSSQKRRMTLGSNAQPLQSLPLDYYLKIGSFVYQVCLKIEDVSAQLGIGGLKDYGAKVGLPMADKGTLDDLKACMDVPYEREDSEGEPGFETYLRYAAGDCVSELIRQRVAKQMIPEVYESLGMKMHDEPKKTTGSMVASFLRDFLYQKVLDYPYQPKSKKYTDALEGLPDLDNSSTDGILAASSTKGNLGGDRDGSSFFGASTHGGRAKNERPMDWFMSGIIPDIDISGCYAAGLMAQIMPIGLPTILENGRRQTPLTLRKCLRNYEKQFVPGLWTAVVSTKQQLSFQQNLIPSKSVSRNAFRDLVAAKRGADEVELSLPFRILTKEISNGILTHDILQLLRAHCSNKEMSELLDCLEVEALIFYPANQRIDDPKEWIKGVGETGIIEFQTYFENGDWVHQKTDKRSRKWLAVPMADIMGPLIKTRMEFKNGRKGLAKDSEEYQKHDAKQSMFKLFCNTIYGTLASPFFDTSNVVVANNITARSRGLVWMMAVAFGLNACITDGGAYDINSVWKWGKKFPGLDTVSNLSRQHNIGPKVLETAKLETMPLGGSKWTYKGLEERNGLNYVVLENEVGERVVGRDGDWGYFDDLAWQHLKEFYRGKDVDILFGDGIDAVTDDERQGQFRFEHKDIYQSLVWQSQANYQFQTFEGKFKTKARGHSLKKTAYVNGDDGELCPTDNANILRFFAQMRATGGKCSSYPATYTQAPLKINQANASAQSAEMNPVREYGLMAGDSIWKKSTFSPISLSAFYWQTQDQFDRWNKANEKLKTMLGWGLEVFYYDSETGLIDYARAMREIQLSIDSGDRYHPAMPKKGKAVDWDFVKEKMPSVPEVPAIVAGAEVKSKVKSKAKSKSKPIPDSIEIEIDNRNLNPKYAVMDG